MKRSIILTTFIFLVVNGVLGYIITAYLSTNVYMNSVVILLSGIVLLALSYMPLKDAFKYSLSYLFGLIGFVEYILGFFAPSELNDNWFVVLIVVILFLEIILISLTNFVTQKNNRV